VITEGGAMLHLYQPVRCFTVLTIAFLGMVICVALTACGGGGGGGSSPPSQGGPPGQTVQPVASQVVDNNGGTVSVSNMASPLDGTKVDIPAGALANPTTITIGQVTSGSGQPADVLVTNLGPSGTVFTKPVSVSIKYSQQYLTDNNIADPTTLKVVAMDPGVANDTLGTTVDTVNHLVTAQTTHFSNFAALGYTNASLNGTYKAVGFQRSLGTRQDNTPSAGTPLPAPRGFRSTLHTFAFDGLGNFTTTNIENLDGTVSNVGPISGTYSVTTDGTVSINAAGVSGTVLAGGSVFLLSSTSTGTNPGVIVGIKQVPSTFSNASLNGTYKSVGYRFGLQTLQGNTPSAGSPLPVPRGFSSSLSTFSFDGNGHYAPLTRTKNLDGVISNPQGQGGVYSVAADGTVSIDNGVVSGAVLAGGSVFIVTSTAPGGDPEISIGIKQMSGNFSNATVIGKYKWVDFQFATGNAQPNAPGTGAPLPAPHGFRSGIYTVQNSVDINGNGTYTATVNNNLDGVISTYPQTGTYSIAADGTLVSDSAGGFHIEGAVLAGGAVAIVSSVTAGQDPAISIGIRQ
jgi:hypothetical protein